MASQIYLFPDTNLFVQCRPLDQLDWSEWGAYDEVHLLVCRPVQAEIDKQKGGGNNRLATRARKASSIFRDIIRSSEGYIEVKSAKPIVRLFLRPELKRDETLKDQLCYDERDDQLIGIAKLFSKKNQDCDVKVLTYDTGPMATAQLVGLSFVEIPESWLLAAEVDEAQKKINALLVENTRLKSAEPSFQVVFEINSNNIEVIESEIKAFIPLTAIEINYLMSRIKEKFPPEKDFGLKDASERSNDIKSGLQRLLQARGTEEFIPATDEQILDYKNKVYPNWLIQCEKAFSKIHEELNRRINFPKLLVCISNKGTRPAEDALVTFTTSGKLGIQPPPPRDDDSESEADEELALPQVPCAPKGHWEKIFPARNITSIMGISQSSLNFPYKHLSVPKNFSQDPNCFYYKDRPYAPVRSFALTCAQFRHRSDEEFNVIIYTSKVPGKVEGALVVKIEAANISDPIVEHIPVRIVVSEVSPILVAEDLIEKL